MNAHYVKHVHADFIECRCGHLAVTESDFDQHVAQMRRFAFNARLGIVSQPGT